MADIIHTNPNASPIPDEQDLLEAMELLFFAYRDFIADPDAILSVYGFGRAHHRVVHFVGRHPGITVAELLKILKITKQSLARVLKQLISEGYVEQRQGTEDRRQRLLHLTDKGRGLARQLAAPQEIRVARALEAAGPGALHVLREALTAMINDGERTEVAKLIGEGELP